MELIESIPMLLARTKEKKLKWDKLGTNSFFTTVGSVVVSVTNSNMMLSISLMSEDGTTTLETKHLNNLFGNMDEGYEELGELYELARRDALKINNALQALKDGLDKL